MRTCVPVAWRPTILRRAPCPCVTFGCLQKVTTPVAALKNNLHPPRIRLYFRFAFAALVVSARERITSTVCQGQHPKVQ